MKISQEDLDSALYEAIGSLNIEIIEFFLKNGANPSIYKGHNMVSTSSNIERLKRWLNYYGDGGHPNVIKIKKIIELLKKYGAKE